jgi:ribosomal protein S18 acetylase RimI-like enzyme
LISFQPPTEAIVEDIAKVHVLCWQQAYAGLMDVDFLRNLSVESRAKNWMKTIADQEVFSRVAFDGSGVVGFISSGPSRSPEIADSEIYAIYVLASHYGRGIGSALFRLAEADWYARGGQKLLANVLTGNAKAHSFYHAMGGVIAEEKPFEMAGMKLREHVFVFDKHHKLSSKKSLNVTSGIINALETIL